MKCEKCGYDNSEYDIICEKCGSPLNIEKNIELQKKYNNKQRAIDIEEIRPEHPEIYFDNTKKKVINILVILFAIIIFFLVGFVFNLAKIIRSRDIITQYDDFLNTYQSGVIYLGSDEDGNEWLKSLSDNYNINYLYINTEKITNFKKNRIKKSLGLNKVNSTIVLVDNKKAIASIDKFSYNNRQTTIEFFQNNDIIPLKLGSTKEAIANFEQAIISKEPMLIFMVNHENKDTKKHNELIKDFCNDYSIGYTYIEGFYLTKSQQLTLLRKLNYNETKDELLVFVDEEQVKEVIEDISSDKNSYFNIATNYGMIDQSSANSLININFNQLKDKIISENKNIILFESAECEYCNLLKPIIGKIGIQNNLSIYRYMVVDKDVPAVNELLVNSGYTDGLTPPLLIVTENGRVLDYIVGLSDKNLIEDKLGKIGVIR